MRFTLVPDPRAFHGVAAAALLGLMLGGAMQPKLRELSDIEGPQMLQPVSGQRVQFVSRSSAYEAYRWGLPDYVIGTDWLHLSQPLEAETVDEAEPEPEHEVAAYQGPSPSDAVVRLPEVEAQPGPAEPPSMGGDILAGVGVPPPPDPPEEEAAEAGFDPPAA